jgi:hypothetical protein
LTQGPIGSKAHSAALEIDAPRSGTIVLWANGGEAAIAVFNAAPGSVEPFAAVITKVGMALCGWASDGYGHGGHDNFSGDPADRPKMRESARRSRASAGPNPAEAIWSNLP